MRRTGDTICAQATAPGEGGIAVIRVSGPEARTILSRTFAPAHPPLRDRMLTFGHVLQDGAPVDEVMAVMLPGPGSYTREDVAEIHCHGSQAVVSRILRILMAHGARMAGPGEFTYRAFIGGRIDLSQAEAVMRMVKADSDRAMASALRQMEGGVSSFVRAAREEITEMLADLAAAIDFPDEVDEQETGEALKERCGALIRRLRASVDPREGRLEDEGLRVALFGSPNAGKSSLLNALLGEDRAIVTSVPGTTRDLLTEKLQIKGLSVILTDTAGLRETCDMVEQIGVDRAQKALSEADVRLLVLDGSRALSDEDLQLAAEKQPRIIALSKADLAAAFDEHAIGESVPGAKVLRVSSVTGEGMPALKEAIFELASSGINSNATITQARHAEAAMRAVASLEDAVKAVEKGFGTEMAGIDLSAALDALGEITGETMNEAVIDRVFQKFCVGK